MHGANMKIRNKECFSCIVYPTIFIAQKACIRRKIP